MRTRHTRRGLAYAALLAGILSAARAGANGEAEYVAPLDRPVSASPDRPLPFPVVEEPVPRGTPSIAAERWPSELVYLTAPNLDAGSKHDNAVGGKRECFESIQLRGTSISAGKITIPAGGLGYVAEAWPGALPLNQDVICVAGVPRTLVDLEQSIVTRKNVTLAVGEGAVLGSEVFRFRSVTDFGNLKSAVIEVTALSGFDWARLGTGSLEVSTTEPGWHARTFHYGMHQGRLEEVTPKSVRFAWLSGLRTDSIVLAGKRELAEKLAAGAEAELADGAKIKVTRVDLGLRQVDVETPEGKKTLSAPPDSRLLPADSTLRKRLIAVGTKYAFVLVPEASDFAGRKAHIEVYSDLRRYRHGDGAPEDRAFKAYPLAHYTGAVLGLYLVNEQPLELAAGSPGIKGPGGAFELFATFGEGGELEALELRDRKGGKSAALPLGGRKSADLIAGAGPTVDAILGRAGSGTAATLHELWWKASQKPAVTAVAKASAPSPAPEPAMTRAELFRPDRIRAALPWALFSAAIGLVIGFLLGRMGRKRAASWD